MNRLQQFLFAAFRWHRSAMALALTLLMAILLPSRVAYAATITVNTAADEFGSGGSCSLREAIQAANTNAPFGGCSAGTAGADTITLPGRYVYTLHHGPE